MKQNRHLVLWLISQLKYCKEQKSEAFEHDRRSISASNVKSYKKPLLEDLNRNFETRNSCRNSDSFFYSFIK